MKKAILISIRPIWVAKILNGEKTLEIRKTFPKCKLPIDVYIYCTKENDLFKSYIRMGYFTTRSTADDMKYNGKGKVVAKFTLNKVEEHKVRVGKPYPYLIDCVKACLTNDELEDYAFVEGKGYQTLYAWHIDNLEIFDKPKELREFNSTKGFTTCEHCLFDIKTCNCEHCNSLTCAPQSYMFIEV